MTRSVQTVIVGGGISGLVCAYSLQKAGIETVVVEVSSRPGGVMHTQRRDGFRIERGPQSFSGTHEISQLCDELGLRGERVLALANAPRYLLIDGALKQMPMSPPALLASSLLDTETKWSLLRDIFGKTCPPEADESVANFVRRKFSPQLLERLVGPFVSGIYAGDPERLSLRGAFPQWYQAEKASGSILRGMIKAMRTKKGPRERPTLQTFREGNETLPRALAAKLGEKFRCGVGVSAMRRSTAANSSKYQVTLRAAEGESSIEAAQVILAAPASVVQKLLCGLDRAFESALGGIEYAAIAVVSLGYRQEDIGHTLEGFGFLVPRSSRLRVLGSVWNSSLFPDRAPEGHALLTSFVGGATDTKAVTLSAEELAGIVHREIASVLGIRKGPVFSNVTLWPQALPQYNLGHVERMAALESQLRNFPGVWLTGNYLRGPSIGACVEQALETAEAVRERCNR